MVISMVAVTALGATTPARDNTKAKPGASAPPATKSGGGGVFTQDFEAAKALAQDQGLPLLLFFTGSDWCGWCMKMKAEVFETQEWQRYAKDNLVLVTLDYPKNEALVPKEYVERNKTLQRTYGANGFPTTVLLAPDGQTTLEKFAGAQLDAKAFISQLKKLTQPLQIGKLSEADKVKYDALVGEQEKIQGELQAWQEKNPDLKNALNKRKQDDFIKRINAVEAKIADLFKQVKK